jgi:hypothetical protein
MFFRPFSNLPHFFYDTPVMIASSQCRSGGMGVVLGKFGRERAR